MGIDCGLDLGRGSDGAVSQEQMRCFVGSPLSAVIGNTSRQMSSVSQVFFGLSRVTTLLPSLGPAKLVRHSWI